MQHRFFRLGSLLLWICMTASLAAQEEQADSLIQTYVRIEAGLGISGLWTPSVWNYINTFVDLPAAQKASGFIGTSEFFVDTEVRIDSSWSVGLEYSYGLWSHNWAGNAMWDYEEQLQMPAVCIHYIFVQVIRPSGWEEVSAIIRVISARDWTRNKARSTGKRSWTKNGCCCRYGF